MKNHSPFLFVAIHLQPFVSFPIQIKDIYAKAPAQNRLVVGQSSSRLYLSIGYAGKIIITLIRKLLACQLQFFEEYLNVICNILEVFSINSKSVVAAIAGGRYD